jgi:hypothetical protein
MLFYLLYIAFPLLKSFFEGIYRVLEKIRVPEIQNRINVEKLGQQQFIPLIVLW